MSADSNAVVNYQRRRKKDLITIFGGRCLLCGFDSFQEALEFHHVNPEEKEFSLGSVKNLEDQLTELKKCVMLCSNCHKGVHGGYYSLPENWQSSYNEEVANSLKAALESRKSKTVHLCKRCGKEISKNGVYCKECYALLQRKADRPSREELKSLIREKPFTQIGQLYGVTDNAIRKWCIGYSLPSKRKDIKHFSDSEWEKI